MGIKQTIDKQWSKLTKTVRVLLAGYLLLIVLIIGFLYWYKEVYTLPSNVFWGAIGNNLRTSSITKKTIQSSQQSSVTTYTKLSFSPSVQVQTIKQLVDKSPGGAKVTVEAIGTQDADYQRYISIDRKLQNGKKLDYSSVYGLWLKGSNTQNPPKLVAGSLFGSLLFANLPPNQYNKIFDELRSVYDPHYSKTANLNGRKAYVYLVNINMRNYALAVQDYVQALGIKANLAKPDSYPKDASVSIQLSIDALSRQVIEAKYTKVAAPPEEYLGYGITTRAEKPSKIVSVQAFQQAIQEVGNK